MLMNKGTDLMQRKNQWQKAFVWAKCAWEGKGTGASHEVYTGMVDWYLRSSGLDAPSPDLARAKTKLGVRQVWFWHRMAFLGLRSHLFHRRMWDAAF